MFWIVNEISRVEADIFYGVKINSNLKMQSYLSTKYARENEEGKKLKRKSKHLIELGLLIFDGW